jgi:uncharacterized protein YgbK (DUF1537 family)
MRLATPKIAIIADDLTGACDSAAQFARPEVRPFVCMGVPTLERVTLASRAAIAAFDIASRHEAPEEAARRAGEACRLVRLLGFQIVFKKIDSTMRGNVGAESIAAAEALEARGALLCPAFPRQGRVVRGGTLFVRDRPVDEALAADAVAQPPPDPDLRAALSRALGAEVGLVTLEAVRRGPDTVSDALGEFEAEGVRLCAADAETDGDLRTLADVLLAPETNWLPAGSAGLARAIAIRLLGDEQPLTVTLSRPGTIMVVSGSLADLTRRQIAAAVKAGEVSRVAMAARTTRAGVEFLGEREVPIAALVIIGGETARRLLSDLGVWSAWVLGEMLPGVPVLSVAEGPYSGMTIVTKGGNMGDDETLVECLRRLRELATGGSTGASED